MTVASTNNRVQFNGSGTTGPFATGFGILDESHLTVIKTDSGGTDTTLVLTTDYTVSNITSSSADVTTVATVDSGEKLTIIRNVPYTQTTDLINGAAFNADTVENAFDKATQQVQKLDEEIGRTLKAPTTSSITDGELPSVTANYILRVNSSADGFEAVTSTAAGLDAGSTPTDGNFLVGDGTSFVEESGNTARTSLGLGTGDSPQFTNGVYSGTEALQIPVGTTAQRPGTPVDGDLRVNTTDGNAEVYRDSAWRSLEGGGLANVVDDTTPQLGGQLDVNGNAIGDGTRELLTFTEDASAVNHVEIENEATGSGPIVRSAGDDAAVDLNIDTKSTGTLNLNTGGSNRADINASGLRLGAANARVTTILDEDTMSSDSATALATQQSIKAYVDSAGGGAGKYELISTVTASNDATVEFTGLSSTYFKYIVIYSHLVPATDDVDLYMRTSTDNGLTFDSGSSDYESVVMGYSATGVGASTVRSYGTTADTKIWLADNDTGAGAGTGTGEFMNGEVHVYNPSAADYTFIEATGTQHSAGSQPLVTHVAAFRASAADVDAIQLYMSSGNISSGTFKLYGVKAT